MDARKLVGAGVRNALARQPKVDRALIEQTLRRANRTLGRKLGHVEWSGSFAAYIRRTADLMIEGWTVDLDDPLDSRNTIWEQPTWFPWERDEPSRPLERLRDVEQQLWALEYSAHSTARLTKTKRLPVYLRAIERPALAADASRDLLVAAKCAAKPPPPRERDFASWDSWKFDDPAWKHAQACVAVPFLTQIAACFAAGLLGAATLRRGAESRTILLARPCLSLRTGRLHSNDTPAVIWPDGSGRWYWDGIAIPEQIAQARDQLTADEIGRIRNQEVRRVTLERVGWERFLQTADAELVAQDDFGKLWSTNIWLDGERARLVEVVNATAEADGSYRRYFLRVPPDVRTPRAAVAWTFGFDSPSEYLVSAQS
jgi:hypothetical protein